MTDGLDIHEALEHIDPASLSYEDWCAVGMALHADGHPASVWREWSMRDPRRFDERDFRSKWDGFGKNAGKSVTTGTVFKMALDAGWRPSRPEREHHALDWDSEIGGHEPAIVDPTMVGEYDAEVKPIYSDGHGRDELRAFIDALFEPSEYVSYVIDYTLKADEHGVEKAVPGSRGIYSRTAGEIKSALAGGLDNGIGTTSPRSGAWIRFNPVDGNGVGNDNVTSHRFALLESDDMPVGEFAAIVKQLNLPVAAMVDSGGKSLHAIIHIDADDARQYRERVDVLYARAEKKGIKVDKANKNPARLCRMPGVKRGERRQFLAGLASGAADWDEWDEWYQAETDDLPDAGELDIDLMGDRPEMAPALIDGMLRVRDKMLLAGPSKAGKSFALMELCGALATGGEWFGCRCRKSRVLYVNLELTAASCAARFYDVLTAMGVPSKDVGNIIVWNLKGRGRALDKLAGSLVRRAVKARADVAIIDPIYKVMAGDENNARDIGEFTNILDRCAEDAGISIIYCHHHSKGYQGEKRSIDRASGSGVFGRDADAVVDMIELDPGDGERMRRANRRACAAVRTAVETAGRLDGWDDDSDLAVVHERALDAASGRLDAASGRLDGQTWAEVAAEVERIMASRHSMTAWRIEATLREFPKTDPVTAWFDWPLHVADAALADAPEMGSVQAASKGRQKTGVPRAEKPSTRELNQIETNEAVADAVQICKDNGEPETIENVSKYLKTTPHIKKKDREGKKTWLKNALSPSSDQHMQGWFEWYLEGEAGKAHILVRKPVEKVLIVTPQPLELEGCRGTPQPLELEGWSGP